MIDGFEQVVANCGILAEGFGILGRPVLVSVQYPKGLGDTVAGARRSGCRRGHPDRREDALLGLRGGRIRGRPRAAAGCSDWVVAGIETHVCVNQTVLDLMARDYAVHVAGDAVSSRAPANREPGARADGGSEGAEITSTEMALFEMLEVAGSDEFKAISRLVR